MSGMRDMTPRSLAMAAAPRKAKSLKIVSLFFERGENLLQSNRVTKLEFKHTKNGIF